MIRRGRDRNHVERTFGKLKQRCRVATRYNKPAPPIDELLPRQG
jgi:transposase